MRDGHEGFCSANGNTYILHGTPAHMLDACPLLNVCCTAITWSSLSSLHNAAVSPWMIRDYGS